MIDMSQAIVQRDVNLQRPGDWGDRITVILPLKASTEISPLLSYDEFTSALRLTVIEDLKRRIWREAYQEFELLAKEMLQRIAMWHPRGAEADYSNLRDRLQELLAKAP